jgi:hypothetical protein
MVFRGLDPPAEEIRLRLRPPKDDDRQIGLLCRGGRKLGIGGEQLRREFGKPIAPAPEFQLLLRLLGSPILLTISSRMRCS